ncbi:SanA/YdcF family protein, partial [Mobilicoccus pelagius]
LDVAADLLRRGRVDRILVSGDGGSEHHDEPGAMRRHLLARGIPGHLVVTDPEGRDTWASCVRAAEVYDVHDVALVSQTYHLPRALALARAAGLDAVGVGDDSMRTAAPAVWNEGVARERLAAVKAGYDVLTRRGAAPRR